MKLNKKYFSILFLLLIFIFIVIQSCDLKYNTDKPRQGADTTLIVYCDESIYDLLLPTIHLYDSIYKDVKLDIKKCNAREAMKKLFAKDAGAIIISRDYLKDEENILQQNSIPLFKQFAFAEDALVFYVKNDFPLDTINQIQLKQLLLNPEKKISDFFPNLKFEVQFVSPNEQSSEFSNLIKLVTDSIMVKRKLIKFSTNDSVKKYILNNKNYIGVSYLSQIVNNNELKVLKIGYETKELGSIFPHNVNIPNIVQRFYPYIITHSVLLQEDNKNPAWWLGVLLSRNDKIQTYLFKNGIVPLHAQFKFIEQE